VPEGDAIFRAARTLHLALAGRRVTRFESVFPHLTRVDDDHPLRGRAIERVTARGKHLLISFSGSLVLHTHMRMHGSWHIYRSGERWQRPRRAMRIVIGTDEFEAVAFDVPVAEFIEDHNIARHASLRDLGPDPLAADFDAAEAARRIGRQTDREIGDVLLDQTVIAGIGNIFKSEILFLSGINPFAAVGSLPPDAIELIATTARRLMRANAGKSSGRGIVTYSGLRRTGALDRGARVWVYGRGGRPCRRCGTPVSRRKQGRYARSTYWCEKCQSKSQIPNPKSQFPNPT
jgi:endonuclease-8